MTDSRETDVPKQLIRPPGVDIQGHWIWDTRDGAADQGVTCLFRRSFDGRRIGPRPVLHISADSRYRAYVNGRLISRGPCRGTPDHYFYETVDLAPHLRNGPNVLAVEVRWYGRRFEPRPEVHLTPGLWAMLGPQDNPAALVTDADWKVLRSPGHALRPLPANHPVSGWYHVVDPIEDTDLIRIPFNWREPDFEDSAWSNAIAVRPAIGCYQPRSWFFSAQDLAPREIPPMEETPLPPAALHQYGTMTPAQPPELARQIDGPLTPGDRPAAVFWGTDAPPLVLDGTGTHYLIVDMGRVFTGYPKLTLTAPAGAMVEFRYAEALSRNYKKAVRDDPAGTVEGYYDLFTCRPGRNTVEPFVWRGFRFLRIAVHHPAEPVTLERLETVFTAYPLHERAAFASSDPLHKQLWDTSWWTLRLGVYEQAWTRRLHNWTDQLALHATTWFETREPSRSDCHAFGSWIMTEFLTAIPGITPAAPGFAQVRVAPHCLDLDHVKGTIPTVRGPIHAAWKRNGGKIRYEIDLPSPITGRLLTPTGEQFPLAAGRQTVEFSDKPSL